MMDALLDLPTPSKREYERSFFVGNEDFLREVILPELQTRVLRSLRNSKSTDDLLRAQGEQHLYDHLVNTLESHIKQNKGVS